MDMAAEEGRTLIGQRASAAFSGGTVATGLSTYFKVIPEVCGVVASLFGIVLSTVLIYDRIKKGILERKKLRMEIESLERELKKGGT